MIGRVALRNKELGENRMCPANVQSIARCNRGYHISCRPRLLLINSYRRWIQV